MDSHQRILLFATIGTVLYTAVTLLYLVRRRAYKNYRTSDAVRRLFPIIITIFTAMIALVTFVVSRLPSEQKPPAVVISNSEHRLKAIEGDVKRLTMMMDTIEKQLAQVPASITTNGQSPSPAALTVIDQRITQNTEAIHKFEQLFVTDASRLVTLPLMQRDFQAVKDDLASVKENVSGLRAQVTEAGTQNRWVIGTLALGMLALVVPAVRSLFAPGGKKEEQKPELK
jgi:amino acid transporter